MARKIIIDTDPGQDDAVAILLALGSPELDVLGITVVAGNVPLALTARNACQVLELAGRSDIDVYAGAARPLCRPLVTAEHVHGASGLDGAPLPEPQMKLANDGAVAFLINTLREAEPGEITLCALGPLTNLALAFAMAPDIIPRIREIVLMGGAYFEVGNITPAAEFNFFVDPEAASSVFKSGAPIIMAPLDVTHKALVTHQRNEAIRAIGTKPGLVAASWTEFFERYDRQKYGTDGAPLHDPCVIAWLIAPELFSGRSCNVEIETSSELTRGMSVVDWWQVTDRSHNAFVLGDVSANGFFELLTDRIGRL